MKRRKKNISPTQLCLNYLRARNIPVQVTERWVSFGKSSGIRRDIFGGDLIALFGDSTLNIQAGASQHASEKVKKAFSLPEVRQWLSSPSRLFQIWTWKKRPAFKKSGGRKLRDEWAAKVTQLELVNGKIIPREFVLAVNSVDET
jgi:hypothetical protein